jgi:hypothetical protein
VNKKLRDANRDVHSHGYLRYKASKKTVASWLILSILPAIMAYVTFQIGDKGNSLHKLFFDINMISFDLFMFFGVIIPIFFTACYHVSGTTIKRNIDKHMLSRFFIIRG